MRYPIVFFSVFPIVPIHQPFFSEPFLLLKGNRIEYDLQQQRRKKEFLLTPLFLKERRIRNNHASSRYHLKSRRSKFIFCKIFYLVSLYITQHQLFLLPPNVLSLKTGPIPALRLEIPNESPHHLLINHTSMAKTRRSLYSFPGIVDEFPARLLVIVFACEEL